MLDTAELLKSINDARDKMIDPVTETPKHRMIGHVKDLQRELKTFLYPKLWYFIDEMLEAHEGKVEVGSLFPSCELHSYLLGLLPHMIDAIVHM